MGPVLQYTGTTQRVGATASRRARRGESGGDEASAMRWEHRGGNDVVDAKAMRRAWQGGPPPATAKPVSFVAPFPTIPNIQGLARFDEDGNQND